MPFWSQLSGPAAQGGAHYSLVRLDSGELWQGIQHGEHHLLDDAPELGFEGLNFLNNEFLNKVFGVERNSLPAPSP